MPDLKNTLSQKLSYLHALWANPEARFPQDLVATFKEGTVGKSVLDAYKKACKDNDIAKATEQLAAIRDLLLAPQANG